MTLRGRLTAAFLAVVLGPVLLGSIFVALTVAMVSRDRTAERNQLFSRILDVRRHGVAGHHFGVAIGGAIIIGRDETFPLGRMLVISTPMALTPTAPARPTRAIDAGAGVRNGGSTAPCAWTRLPS